MSQNAAKSLLNVTKARNSSPQQNSLKLKSIKTFMYYLRWSPRNACVKDRSEFYTSWCAGSRPWAVGS